MCFRPKLGWSDEIAMKYYLPIVETSTNSSWLHKAGKFELKHSSVSMCF